jgi:hypothetical protein
MYNNHRLRHEKQEESDMPTNEQHLQLVLAACRAKRVDDTRNMINTVLAAFSFGTGCAFAWFVVVSIMSLVF